MALEFQRDRFNLWCYAVDMHRRRNISAWLNGFDELSAATSASTETPEHRGRVRACVPGTETAN